MARFAFEVSEKDTGYSDLKDIVTAASAFAKAEVMSWEGIG